MPTKTYHFGLLSVVFGGFLMLGRGIFAGLSDPFGMLGLLFMIFGMMAGAIGLADSSTH